MINNYYSLSGNKPLGSIFSRFCVLEYNFRRTIGQKRKAQSLSSTIPFSSLWEIPGIRRMLVFHNLVFPGSPGLSPLFLHLGLPRTTNRLHNYKQNTARSVEIVSLDIKISPVSGTRLQSPLKPHLGKLYGLIFSEAYGRRTRLMDLGQTLTSCSGLVPTWQ